MPNIAISKKLVASVLFLTFLTALAIYALIQSLELSLPIPTVIAGFTIITPFLTGFITIFLRRTTTITPATISRLFALLLVLQAVVAGVASTYNFPASALDCPLSDSWLKLYRTKNAVRIRAIQDAFNCCGLRSVRDMPFPFPSKNDRIDVNTCANRFARTQSCLVVWRAREQQIAGLLLTIEIISIAYMCLVGIERWPQEAWGGWLGGTRCEQRAISYEDGTGGERYRDEPDTQQDEESGGSLGRANVRVVDEEDDDGNGIWRGVA